jgi:hypothetical protein
MPCHLSATAVPTLLSVIVSAKIHNSTDIRSFFIFLYPVILLPLYETCPCSFSTSSRYLSDSPVSPLPFLPLLRLLALNFLRPGLHPTGAPRTAHGEELYSVQKSEDRCYIQDLGRVRAAVHQCESVSTCLVHSTR